MKASYRFSTIVLVAAATLSFVASFQLPFSSRSGIRPLALSRRTAPIPTHHYSSPVLRASSRESTPGDEIGESNTPESRGPRTLITALAWAGFVAYAFLLAPGKDPASTALDAQLLKDIIGNPFSPTLPPIFLAIFNALGLMPLVYSSLLLPGSRNQSPPAWPFCVGSFAFGFFAMGPYLALRSFQPSPGATPSNRMVARFVENKLPAALAFISSLYLVYLVVGGGGGGGGVGGLEAYLTLFRTQTLPHVSSLDLLILSVFVADPMREDMLRRGWYSGGKLAAFVSVPVVGPCLYLLLRPALSVDEEEEV